MDIQLNLLLYLNILQRYIRENTAVSPTLTTVEANMEKTCEIHIALCPRSTLS